MQREYCVRKGGRACGRMDGRTDGQTSMTKLTVAFHNVTNVPKHGCPCSRSCSCLDSQVSERGCTDQTNTI